MNALTSSLGSTAALPGGPLADQIDRFAQEQATTASTRNELGQDEFLKLMLTQIEHQDPFKPMENGEFIGQMAQFSTVTGIGEMQTSLESLSGTFGAQQTLEAAGLVGKDVLSVGDTYPLGEGEGFDGRFALNTAASEVTMLVTDGTGALVARRGLGEYPNGRHDFHFDGIGEDGEPLPDGDYQVTLMAGSAGLQAPAETFVSHRIGSVEFGAGGEVVLNASSGVQLSLSEIREIRNAVTPPADPNDDLNDDVIDSPQQDYSGERA